MARNVAFSILDASDENILSLRCEYDFFFRSSVSWFAPHCLAPFTLQQRVAFVAQIWRFFFLRLPVCEAGTSAERSGSKFKRLPLFSLARENIDAPAFSNMPIIVPQISLFCPLICFTHNPQVLFLTLSGSSFQLRGSGKKIQARNFAVIQLSRCRNTEVLDSFWGMLFFMVFLKRMCTKLCTICLHSPVVTDKSESSCCQVVFVWGHLINGSRDRAKLAAVQTSRSRWQTQPTRFFSELRNIHRPIFVVLFYFYNIELLHLFAWSLHTHPLNDGIF